MKKDGGEALNEGDEDDRDFTDDLLQPYKVAIADDTNAYQLSVIAFCHFLHTTLTYFIA